METNHVVELLVSWLPMVLFIGVWIFYMRRHGPAGFQQQVIEEYRKNNELLREVIARMDQRISRLEERDRTNDSV